MSAAALQAVRFKQCADRMLTLGELCDLVAGRVPLLIELKSRFDGDLRLVARAAAVLTRYRGPAALMSFDPRAGRCAARHAPLRSPAASSPSGIMTHCPTGPPPRAQKFRLAHLLHAPARGRSSSPIA